MKKGIKIIAMLSLLFSLNAQSQNVNFNATELYPEGVSYSKKQDVFFVSSLHYGKIGKVDKQGNYSEFVNDEELVSSLGLLIDDSQNKLYVAVADPGVSTKTQTSTQGKLAKLIVYNTKTGTREKTIDLGSLNAKENNFANDIAMDKSGNLYITNSFSPIIFKVDKSGKSSVFATYQDWKGEGFNLNGIVYHPDGYLLASQSNTGFIFKVSLTSPRKIEQVKGVQIGGADGLILNKNNELVVISNSKQEVFLFKSTDKWLNASQLSSVKTVLSFPTTGVKVNDKIFVLNAKLNELFDIKATKTSNFILQEVIFSTK